MTAADLSTLALRICRLIAAMPLTRAEIVRDLGETDANVQAALGFSCAQTPPWVWAKAPGGTVVWALTDAGAAALAKGGGHGDDGGTAPAR